MELPTLRAIENRCLPCPLLEPVMKIFRIDCDPRLNVGEILAENDDVVTVEHKLGPKEGTIETIQKSRIQEI
jgi:hypothetical protein